MSFAKWRPFCLGLNALIYVLACKDDNVLENAQAPHRWPCVRGIHRLPVDSRNKGPVMQ